jgi:exonuclease III
MLRTARLDFLGVQETIKASFSQADLQAIDPNSRYCWKSIPSAGHSSGMLLGVNEDSFEVIEWNSGVFFISVAVLQLDTNKTWTFFLVYGRADHRRTPDFLAELSAAIMACPHPLVVGGDFNLIRGPLDKNNDNINWPRVHRFNDFIANLALREIHRVGARYTWSNKQANPVRCVLDRVLMTLEWEALIPLCSLTAETMIGSDHSPLILDSGEELKKRSPRFFFEQGWLERPDFQEMVKTKWQELEQLGGPSLDPIDVWNRLSAGLCQFLKGWGANLGKESRDAKAAILAQIQALDTKANVATLDEEG